MVGWALNKCHGKGVPAHRVVNRKGELSGRNMFPNPELMQQLLENEGLVVIENKIENFKEAFWNPSEHLKQEDFEFNE